MMYSAPAMVRRALTSMSRKVDTRCHGVPQTIFFGAKTLTWKPRNIVQAQNIANSPCNMTFLSCQTFFRHETAFSWQKRPRHRTIRNIPSENDRKPNFDTRSTMKNWTSYVLNTVSIVVAKVWRALKFGENLSARSPRSGPR